ncbi:MAG TPA: hypothetical protein EYF98_13265 [Planctomycetes bacterium]|nr:hypothetical protein [Planctomycetota bacterium]
MKCLSSIFGLGASGWELQAQIGPDFPLGGSWFARSITTDGTRVCSADTLGVGSARVHVARPPVGVVECECSVGPCGNSNPGAGCLNSTGYGSLLGAWGDTRAADVSLVARDAPPGQFGIFFQGDLPLSSPFGDGLLCADQGLVRITPAPIQIDAGGAATFGPCYGDATIPSLTGVVPGSGSTRRYQFWFRDPAGPCGSGFNTSNGLAITW